MRVFVIIFKQRDKHAQAGNALRDCAVSRPVGWVGPDGCVDGLVKEDRLSWGRNGRVQSRTGEAGDGGMICIANSKLGDLLQQFGIQDIVIKLDYVLRSHTVLNRHFTTYAQHEHFNILRLRSFSRITGIYTHHRHPLLSWLADCQTAKKQAR